MRKAIDVLKLIGCFLIIILYSAWLLFLSFGVLFAFYYGTTGMGNAIHGR
jgi:hypothetical protein